MLNPYLNFISYAPSQDMVESLLQEAIQFYGEEVHYLPRTLINIDSIFGEAAQQEFNKAIKIECFVTNIEGYGGGDLMSKFGVEIRDSATIWIPIARFEEEAINKGIHPYFPREGDLIQTPRNGNIWQITYIESEKLFYPLGRKILYEMSLELFEYSAEKFNTKVPAIDSIPTRYPVGNTEYSIPADNAQLGIDASNIIDFSEENPFNPENPFNELF